jgi:hypothetical protein
LGRVLRRRGGQVLHGDRVGDTDGLAPAARATLPRSAGADARAAARGAAAGGAEARVGGEGAASGEGGAVTGSGFGGGGILDLAWAWEYCP